MRKCPRPRVGVGYVGRHVLTAQGLKTATDRSGEHCTPSYLKKQERLMVKDICHAVFGSVYMSTPGSYWPKIFGACDHHCAHPSRKKWLQLMQKLSQFHDVEGQPIDDLFKKDPSWITSAELRSGEGRGDSNSDDPQVLDAIEENIILRYYMASFQHLQLPVDIVSLPRAMTSPEIPKCRKCRAAEEAEKNASASTSGAPPSAPTPAAPPSAPTPAPPTSTSVPPASAPPAPEAIEIDDDEDSDDEEPTPAPEMPEPGGRAQRLRAVQSGLLTSLHAVFPASPTPPHPTLLPHR